MALAGCAFSEVQGRYGLRIYSRLKSRASAACEAASPPCDPCRCHRFTNFFLSLLHAFSLLPTMSRAHVALAMALCLLAAAAAPARGVRGLRQASASAIASASSTGGSATANAVAGASGPMPSCRLAQSPRQTGLTASKTPLPLPSRPPRAVASSSSSPAPVPPPPPATASTATASSTATANAVASTCLNDNVPPTTDFTCDQQKAWGKCKSGGTHRWEAAAA